MTNEISGKGSRENLADVVTNEHLGKCVKCVLTNIWVAGSQIVMETRSGKHGFLKFSLKFEKLREKD